MHIVWKSNKMSHFLILAYSSNFFCPISSNMSGNTFWCLVFVNFGIFEQFLTCLVTLFDRKFQFKKKLVKIDYFWHFWWTFVYSKCRIWVYQTWHFSSIFVLLKLTCLVTLFDCKIQVFKNSPKLTIFGIFNELLSTQNVNVARFARNVEYYGGDFNARFTYFFGVNNSTHFQA